MRNLLFVTAILAAYCQISGQDSQPLTTDEASKKVDQKVTVQMKVQSIGGNRNRYLNSRKVTLAKVTGPA